MGALCVVVLLIIIDPSRKDRLQNWISLASDFHLPMRKIFSCIELFGEWRTTGIILIESIRYVHAGASCDNTTGAAE